LDEVGGGVGHSVYVKEGMGGGVVVDVVVVPALLLLLCEKVFICVSASVH